MDNSIHDYLKIIFEKNKNYMSEDGNILISKIIEDARQYNELLLKFLLSDKRCKERFFKKINDITIFLFEDFKICLNDARFLGNSYTKFLNKIGLIEDKSLKMVSNLEHIVLNYPYKDCTLDGGMTKEETKRKNFKETMINNILFKEDVSKLLSPKTFKNFKKISLEKEKTKEKKIDNINGDENFLINGNNLAALCSLKKKFAGQIKLIYIDPPYNTGNDTFSYNDKFNHSAWLVFMKDRLKIARDLLRDDGVIFVQCDDNEQAYLKVLMDEIFGRENYLNIVSVNMKNIAGASGGGEDKRLKKNIEFVLIYNKSYLNFKWTNNAYDYNELCSLIKEYKNEDISWKYTSILYDPGIKEYIGSTLDSKGNEIKIYTRKNPKYYSVSELANIEKVSEDKIYYKYFKKIYTTAMPQSSIRVKVLDYLNEKNIKEDLISIEYIPISGRNKGKIYEQFYKGNTLRLFAWLKDVVVEKDNIIYKRDLQGTLWTGINLNNLTKEGHTLFKNGKKPEQLLERIINIATQKNDIVLDFFAGSGTTLAVAHKMNRRYIGVEQIENYKNKCIERLKKVIEGEQGGISRSVEWQGGGEFVYMEIATYNFDWIKEIENIKDDKEFKKLYENMKKNSIINHRLYIDYFENKNIIDEKDFLSLDLEEKKSVIKEILEKNMFYVPFSERKDETFKISSEDIKLSEEFYKN